MCWGALLKLPSFHSCVAGPIPNLAESHVPLIDLEALTHTNPSLKPWQAYMGDFDQRNLCKNPTLKGTNPVTNADTRESVGCP